ncbi:hypothetical protein AAC387_Pa11g1841 [Persea americana]
MSSMAETSLPQSDAAPPNAPQPGTNSVAVSHCHSQAADGGGSRTGSKKAREDLNTLILRANVLTDIKSILKEGVGLLAKNTF